MATMLSESVHAIVTDPPYGLEFMGKDWDRLGGGRTSKPGIGERQTEWVQSRGWNEKRCNSCGHLSHGGSPCCCERPFFVAADNRWKQIQEWHHTWAIEAFRVLKPGGHLLAFGGTRTFHRMTVAIEDAGFEIRDCLSWLYGSGFPKSLDVSKAIDKRRDDCRAVDAVRSWLNARRVASGLTLNDVNRHFGHADNGGGSASSWMTNPTSRNLPTWDQWLTLKALLGFGDDMDAEVWRLNGRKGQPGEAWHEREVVGASTNGIAGGTKRHAGQDDAWGFNGEYDVTTPATDLARQWDGWGTALKPAWEPIIVARKPLIGTVAANVTEHSTGAINVDACRIETDGEELHSSSSKLSKYRGNVYFDSITINVPSTQNPLGRWPANVVLDECAAAVLDEQTGACRSAGFYQRQVFGDRSGPASIPLDAKDSPQYDDSGGASRFFYVAKADRAERNIGLERMPKVASGVHDDDSYVWPLNGDGSPRNKKVEPRANHHPTVKPVALMQWLVRLVTPPAGVVLDPFCGSGSTGIAADREGFDFIGIEISPDYAEIARRRLIGDCPLFAEVEVA